MCALIRTCFVYFFCGWFCLSNCFCFRWLGRVFGDLLRLCLVVHLVGRVFVSVGVYVCLVACLFLCVLASLCGV